MNRNYGNNPNSNERVLQKPKSKQRKRVEFITKVGIFSAIAFVLQMMGGMLPKVKGFLEVEASDLPALIISLALGPLAGVMVELIKNLLHAMVSTTGFIGEFANFFINGTFVFTCGAIYNFKRTKNGAILSLIISTIVLVIAGIFVNIYFMLPLYSVTQAMSMNERVALATTVMAPFNLIRGTVLSACTVLIYKKISGFLK